MVPQGLSSQFLKVCFLPGGTGVDAADALSRLQAVAPLNDPFVGYCELAEAVEVALLLEGSRDRCTLRGLLNKAACNLQPADIGWPTGNGKKLSCSQAQLGQATGLAVA